MRCYCSKIHVQVIIISVYKSNNSTREKKCCDILLSFLEAFFEQKSRRGSLHYFEDNKMGFNISFSLFFLSTPLPSAYREIHDNY